MRYNIGRRHDSEGLDIEADDYKMGEGFVTFYLDGRPAGSLPLDTITYIDGTYKPEPDGPASGVFGGPLER